MIRFVIVCLALISSTFANKTIWDSLGDAGSKALVTHLADLPHAQLIQEALSQPNITLFLPSSAAIEAATNASVLDLNQTANVTLNQLLRHVIPGRHNSTNLLSKRQYLLPSDPLSATLPLVVGPKQQNNTLLQVSSGVVTSTVIRPDIVCSNGVIHLIDQFLQRPLSTLATVETIPELENYELLMKSLNLTSIITGENKTVIAPINQAWIDANSSTIPYGTLVHTLKYEVIDGVYVRNTLFYSATGDLTLGTNRGDAALTFRRSSNGNPNQDQLIVIGHTATEVAHVVQSDIITTDGVIHLVDHVLSAHERMASDGSTHNGNSDLSNRTISAFTADGTPNSDSQGATVQLAFHILCASVLTSVVLGSDVLPVLSLLE